MVVLIIDPRTGLSGDMFIGAMINLGVDVKPALDFINEIGKISIMEYEDGIRVTTETKLHHLTMDEALRWIRKASDEGVLGPYGVNIATKIIEVINEAEQHAHKEFKIGHSGKLHEASDILIDSILSAYSLEKLKINEIYCLEPVYVGSGVVRFSHGVFEVPAPATRYIIDKYGIPTEKGPYSAELLTPTGAAILAALDPIFLDRRDLNKNFITIATSKGYGSHKFPSGNYLRLFLAKKRTKIFMEEIVEIETNIDDVTPELIGDLFDSLRDALDMHIINVLGKKNRPAYLVRVWCRKEDEKKLVEDLFKLTGTLGIRRRIVQRYVRPRWIDIRTISIGGTMYKIRIKEGKPEFRDLKKISEETGLSINRLYELLMNEGKQ